MTKAVTNNLRCSQNFLKSKALVRRLVTKSDLSFRDTVLEIGAGRGIITSVLLEKSSTIIAYELDKNLIEKLKQKFKKEKTLKLKHEDFTIAKLPTYPYKVFSNIPFNISSAIIKKLTLSTSPPTESFLVVQEEVAKKFAGRPFGKNNSQISVILNPFFKFCIFHHFKPEDFLPKPGVNTVLLKITKRNKMLIKSKHKEEYQDFVTYTFNQFKSSVREGLSDMFRYKRNILPRLKPSELNFEDWYFLFDKFQKLGHLERERVRGSYTRLLKQQRELNKIHRTRIDKNWKKVKEKTLPKSTRVN